MGKFTILVCAAIAAYALLALVQPETFQAQPLVPVAAAVPAVVDFVPGNAGMAERFQAEKSNAAQHELPQQF
jgi:hypothetical protein